MVSKVPVRSVIETAKRVLYTGHIGDGKIFVYNVENVVKEYVKALLKPDKQPVSAYCENTTTFD